MLHENSFIPLSLIASDILDELKIYLSEYLKREFKRISMETFGYGRDSISKAAAQAIQRWTSERETIRKEYPQESDDPVHMLRGMLRRTSEPSVELQHKARMLRAKRRRS